MKRKISLFLVAFLLSMPLVSMPSKAFAAEVSSDSALVTDEKDNSMSRSATGYHTVGKFHSRVNGKLYDTGLDYRQQIGPPWQHYYIDYHVYERKVTIYYTYYVYRNYDNKLVNSYVDVQSTFYEEVLIRK